MAGDREPRDVLGEALWALRGTAWLAPWPAQKEQYQEHWRKRADPIIARLAEAGYRIVKEGD